MIRAEEEDPIEEYEYEQDQTEEESDDEPDLTFKLSYSKVITKFLDRERKWNEQEILALIWMIRLFMALVFGLFVGLCQIPTLVGALAFVFMCHKVPSGLIKNRVGVIPAVIVKDPRKLVKYGTMTVYMLFISCAISVRLFVGLQMMDASRSPVRQ